MSSFDGRSLVCEKCGGKATITLSSIQIIKCQHCGHDNKWPLAQDRQPLVSCSRDKRRK